VGRRGARSGGESDRIEDTFILARVLVYPIEAAIQAVVDEPTGANVYVVDSGWGDEVYPTLSRWTAGNEVASFVNRLSRDPTAEPVRRCPRLVQQLQQLMRGQLDVPCAATRMRGRRTRSGRCDGPGQVAVHERVPGLPVSSLAPFGEAEVPACVVVPGVLGEIGVLRLGIRLYITPVAGPGRTVFALISAGRG